MQLNEDIACTLDSLTIIHHNKPMTAFSAHDHDGPECIIPLFGGIDVTLSHQAKTLQVKPGQMLLIPAALEHSAESSSKFGERLLIILSADRLKLDQPLLSTRSGLLVELCFELIEDDDTEFRSQATDLVYHLLRKKLEPSELPGQLDTDSLMGQAQDERLKKALHLFESKPGTQKKMAELAAEAGLAERSMQRLFKSELGMSPGTVLTMYRIQKAIQLLQAGDSVTQTAFAVGYSSLSQFIAQFRSLTGRIPSDFCR